MSPSMMILATYFSKTRIESDLLGPTDCTQAINLSNHFTYARFTINDRRYSKRDSDLNSFKGPCQKFPTRKIRVHGQWRGGLEMVLSSRIF